mmetsp:Transcript_19570/g.59241  ORF Transcript_19570/g.59241 Transcript_19570/m.59241 type:complete len:87 (-) Transcript_19570:1396-1656(-)
MKDPTLPPISRNICHRAHASTSRPTTSEDEQQPSLDQVSTLINFLVYVISANIGPSGTSAPLAPPFLLPDNHLQLAGSASYWKKSL